MASPLIEHGGTGPILHLAQANGLPLATYRPIVERLTDRFRCVTLPPRALWPDGGPPPPSAGSWEEVAEDLARGLVARGFRDVVLVGHSFGGVASLLVAARHRPLVRAVAVLDPTILTDRQMAAFRMAKAAGWPGGHPVAVRARERREEFADRDEAFAYWRDRKLFADWSDEALWRYTDGALRLHPAGGLTLAWSAGWEAYYYESIYTEVWDDIARLDPSMPLLVLGGATSDVFVAETRERFRSECPRAVVTTIPGGHLFPQAAPEATAQALSGWLESEVE